VNDEAAADASGRMVPRARRCGRRQGGGLASGNAGVVLTTAEGVKSRQLVLLHRRTPESEPQGMIGTDITRLHRSGRPVPLLGTLVRSLCFSVVVPLACTPHSPEKIVRATPVPPSSSDIVPASPERAAAVRCRAEFDQGHYEAALRIANEALASSPIVDEAARIQLFCVAAASAHALERNAEQKALLAAAHTLYDGAPVLDSRAATCLLESWGRFAMRQGDLSNAEGYLRRTLEVRERTGAKPIDLANALHGLAFHQVVAGRPAEALQYAERGRKLVEGTTAGERTVLTNLEGTLAEAYRYLGRLEESQVPFDRAIQWALRNESRSTAADLMCRLAKVKRSLKRMDEAEALYRRALEIARAMGDEGHQQQSEALEGLIGVLGAQGKNDELALLLPPERHSRVYYVAEDRIEEGNAPSSTPGSPPPAQLSGEAARPTQINATEVVQSRRAGFTACYERALQANREERGTLKVAIKVSASGAVETVHARSMGASAYLVDCVLRHAGAAVFRTDAPATIVVPVTFVKRPKSGNPAEPLSR
jgi:tetratricopeptide (TPR) repeat protein